MFWRLYSRKMVMSFTLTSPKETRQKPQDLGIKNEMTTNSFCDWFTFSFHLSMFKSLCFEKPQLQESLFLMCWLIYTSSILKDSVQFSSVAQSCPNLCNPMAARQASPSITNSQSSHKLMSIESVMPSSHLILCRPLLLLPPILPSIRIFSNESTLCMRWPKYCSFSFSISPSNEYSIILQYKIKLKKKKKRQTRPCECKLPYLEIGSLQCN